MIEEDKKTDLDLEEIPSEEEDLDIDNAPYEIRTLGADFSLELYSQKIISGEINIPDFQRKYVWNQKKASKLIESFLLGLPVPQVFLYQEATKRDFLVVDGQQRLLSSHFFLRGTFSDNRTPFRLKGVRQKWEGKTFEELEESDKRRLRNYILRATIFEQIDPSDNKSVYEIFERLNTGGMPLTEQEVRNCVNHGKINLFLEELNTNRDWRLLLGKEEQDKRMKDIELILRFLALADEWEVYKKPMKDFISTYMEKKLNLPEEEQVRLKTRFEQVTSFISNSVGRDAFRANSGRLNVAMLDSIMTAVALVQPQNISVSIFKESLKHLKGNPAYVDYVSKATTNEEAVKGRIKISVETLQSARLG